MSSELPSFASQWVQQWKDAAPRLQAIRDEELRRLGQEAKGSESVQRVYEKYPERHGMVTMQKWFMRRQMIETRTKKDE